MAGAVRDSSYRPDIDGLRGLAVLLVVFYHYGFPFFGGGYIGVDVFFVISGFLISDLIVGRIEQGGFSLLEFYERRIRRIFPALMAVMLFVLVAAGMLFTPRDFQDAGQSLGATAFFLSNLLFWREAGYFQPVAAFKPLLHTWSLSIEEQFYLLYPLVLLLAARVSPRRLPLWLLFILIAPIGFCFWFTAVGWSAGAFYYAPARVWELMIGGLLAIAVHRRPASKFESDSCVASGLAMIIGAAAGFSSWTAFPLWGAALPCLGAALILYGGGGGQGLLTKLLSWRPLVGLGLVSYGLYLWHWPLRVFWDYALPRERLWFESLGLILVSLGFAVLSWRFLEGPVPRRRGLPGRKTLYLLALATTLAWGAAALVIHVEKGFPQRFDTPLEQPVISNSVKVGTCHLQPWQGPEDYDAAACGFGASGDSPSVLLWGDSHATHLLPGLEALAGDLEVTMTLRAAGGCPPVMGLDLPPYPHCAGVNEEALRALRESEDAVDGVILSAFWAEYWSVPHFQARLRKTVELLTGEGHAVLLVGPTPQFYGGAPRLDAMMGDQAGLAQRKDRALDVEIAAYLEVIAAGAGALYLRADEALCPAGLCSLRHQGQLLYLDSDHLSTAGALLIAPLFQPFLEGAALQP